MATARELAKPLAMFLGPEWRVEPLAEGEPETSAVLKLDDGTIDHCGVALVLYSDRYGAKGKIEIHGRSPANDCGVHITDRKQVTTSINVSATKDPAKIARDIQARLLPEYLPAFADCVERIRKMKTENANAQAVNGRNRAAKGTREPWQQNRNGAWRFISLSETQASPVTKIRSASIELRGVPVSIAEKICKLLEDQDREDADG